MLFRPRRARTRRIAAWLAPTLAAAAAAAPGAARGDTVSTLTSRGFENVAADTTGRAVRFENRRYRNHAYALGVVTAEAQGRGAATELWPSRLGLPLARVIPLGGAAGVPARFQVGYPSDAGVRPPRGPVTNCSAWRADLSLRPLLDFELGRIFNPTLVRVDLAPEASLSPWPGGLAVAGLAFPLRNDFEVDEAHPDVNEVRPSWLAFHQFAWLPGAALVSLSGGYFGDNRWGGSLGAARPWAGGAWLADAQVDLTGMVSFADQGTLYSWPEAWTGWAAVTYRPPLDGVALTARAARYLYGDEGVEAEVTRSFTDLDVSFYVQRSLGFNVAGVRLAIPVPPATRPFPRPVRLVPPDRYTLDYRSEVTAGGTSIAGTASRAELLRQINRPYLEAHGDQFRAGLAGRPVRSAPPDAGPGVSHAGMSGFINTPWAGVLPERVLEVGYQRVPRRWTYDNRDRHDNEVYYGTLGFLPRLEVGVRWTVIPGLKTLGDLVPNSKLTDSDRGLGGRLQLLEPGRWPGLAIGVEDAEGTRRFHSSYVVAGLPIRTKPLQGRLSVGYAGRVVSAARRTLDGVFGAVELSPLESLSAALEHDTEKWNVQLHVALWQRLQLRATWLDLQIPSVGLGFRHRF